MITHVRDRVPQHKFCLPDSAQAVDAPTYRETSVSTQPFIQDRKLAVAAHKYRTCRRRQVVQTGRRSHLVR